MRNILLFIFCCVLSTTGDAQEDANSKKTEFGILMQATFGYLKVEQSDWADLGISNQVNDLETQNRFGFGLGILAKFNVSKYLSIVPQPSLYFQNNQLMIDLENRTNFEESIKPVAIALPVHLVFTKRKWQKWNPSVALGLRYVYGIGEPEVSPNLELQKHELAIDFGAGVEFKFSRFKMKPELLFSRGIMNLKKEGFNLIDRSLTSIHQDQIALRVLFYN